MSHRTDRRRRKKAREQIDLPQPLSPPLEVRDGRHGDMALFAEPKDMLADIRLVWRAIRDGWDVPEKMRDWLPEAIFEVVTMPLAKSGVDEWTLDWNAIAAARVIVEMWGVQLRQEWAEIRRLIAKYNANSHWHRKSGPAHTKSFVR